MQVQRFCGIEDMPPVKMLAEGPQRMRDLRALSHLIDVICQPAGAA